ncbi:MAG: Flp pilus assembly protein CpaB [Candidatus Omnitrophota bacterium]
MDKKKLSIILAFVLASMAVVMIRNYIGQQEKRFIKQEKTGYVLVATTNINAGIVIDESMVKFATVPEQYIQPKAVNSVSLVVGKRAAADIFPGEQIMSTKLTIAMRSTSLAMSMPQGKRATSIVVPLLSAVGGKIRPNDYVDVVGIFPYAAQIDGRAVNEKVSVTLFQNIQVLDVSGNAPPQRGQPAPAPTDLVVTLALTPREIGLMTYAQEQGNLKLVLRPALETTTEPVPPVEVNTLWQYVFSNLGTEFMQTRDQPKVLQQRQEPEPPPQPTMEVFRGTQKTKMLVK